MIALSIILGIALALMAWVGMSYLIHVIGEQNKIIGLSVDELHTASKSLMKTPDDIPDSLLKLLWMMNKSAFDRNTPRIFCKVAESREYQSKTPNDRSPSPAILDLKSMRPELVDLFLTATAAWLNIVCNRDIRFTRRISTAFNSIRVSRHKVRIDEDKVTIELLRKLLQTSQANNARSAVTC